MRSSDSPACLRSRECMSTQTLQPLIWLARRLMRSRVIDGTPARLADVPRACSAFMAPGTVIAGFLIRACMTVLQGRWCRCQVPAFQQVSSSRHIGSISRVYWYDPQQPRNVTMTEQEWLAEGFEEHRTRLRAVAYRMLGSVSEADDAVQEAWLRLSRSETSEIE